MEGIAIQLLFLVAGLIGGAVITRFLVKNSNKKVLKKLRIRLKAL